MSKFPEKEVLEMLAKALWGPAAYVDLSNIEEDDILFGITGPLGNVNYFGGIAYHPKDQDYYAYGYVTWGPSGSVENFDPGGEDTHEFPERFAAWWFAIEHLAVQVKRDEIRNIMDGVGEILHERETRQAYKEAYAEFLKNEELNG